MPGNNFDVISEFMSAKDRCKASGKALSLFLWCYNKKTRERPGLYRLVFVGIDVSDNIADSAHFLGSLFIDLDSETLFKCHD